LDDWEDANESLDGKRSAPRTVRDGATSRKCTTASAFTIAGGVRGVRA